LLAANTRIGQEIAAIPKASGRPEKIIHQTAKNKSGRADVGVKKDARSRLQKLAAIPAAPAFPPRNMGTHMGNNGKKPTNDNEINSI